MRTPTGWVVVLGLFAAGCGDGSRPAAGTAPVAAAADEAAAERAKLAPDDRAAVDAQEWCAINTGERLGEMGPPVKLDVKGQPVFLCCKGCEKKALADPDATLAKVAELKAKKAGK
jgi:hypothetical protein